MLLALDVGNTSIHIGVFKGQKLEATWRIGVEAEKLPDEYGVLLLSLLGTRNLTPQAFDACIMGCDVPPLIPTDHNPADILCRALTGDNGSHSVSYAAEAGIFQKAGFSVVICGPGDIAQAHQPNEFIAVDQIKACEDFMRKLADWAASR